MRKIISGVIFLLLVLSIMGCADNDLNIETKDDNKESMKENEIISDIQDETFDYSVMAVDYEVFNTTWENNNVEYTGDYLEESFEIATSPAMGEFSLLVYVDGRLTPYYSTDNTQLMDYQVFNTEASDVNKKITIFFKPLTGVKGESYDLNVVLFDNPNYMLKDTTWVSFLPNHTICNVCRKVLHYNAETADFDVSNQYVVSELDKRMENYFSNDECIGGNELNEISIFFDLYLEPYDYENMTFIPVDYFSVEKEKKLDFLIPMLGNDGEYIISLYINNNIVAAFDGEEYLDVKIERNQFAQKEVSLSVSEYSGLNQIYVIAVSKENNYVKKSNTYLLEVK